GGTGSGGVFVLGDMGDAVREGTRMAMGQKADELVLGLASAGIAITAATYVTFGAAAPARAGLTLMKVARKTGSLGSELAGSLGRMVRQAGLLEPAGGRADRARGVEGGGGGGVARFRPGW